MASGAATGAKKNSPVNKRLIVVLGILVGVAIIIATIVATSSKKEAADPTLTAAPPIVATPGHPIVIHGKSPEAMALQMQQNGMTPPADASGQPVTK